VPLKDSLDKTYNALGTTAGALGSIGNLVGQIDTTLTSVNTASQSLIEALDSSLNLIQKSQERVDDMINDVNKVADNKQLNKIMDIMKNDPERFSDFMMKPTDMQTNKIYPVENYGSAMAPFYTILAIWVGGLILVALLKTKVDPVRAEGMKLYETYFGRYLTFMLFGIMQALVVSLGDLYMLKIQCLEPAKFVLAAVIASIIFTNITFSMTVSFGDVGKALVVVFMVIQVAGSGGTFPIQVTPKFFQMVNPLLPFTHLINAMRECVGGVYENAYWIDIRNVRVYIPLSLLVGIVLRKKVLELNEFFEEKLSQTGIM
jgi:putative membrane protein